MPKSGHLFVAFLLLGSIVALTGLRQFFIEPLENGAINALWFVVQILPLLLTLPGLIRARLRSTFILCLISLLYFIHGVLAAFDPTLRVFGALEICLALSLCALTALMVRSMREQGASLDDQ
jgi:uncharacterized membrane protein